MDSDRFDALIRSLKLAATPSRRAIFGLTIGGVVAAVEFDDSESRKKGKGKKRGKKK